MDCKPSRRALQGLKVSIGNQDISSNCLEDMFSDRPLDFGAQYAPGGNAETLRQLQRLHSRRWGAFTPQKFLAM